jgi:flagellar basal body-associated protein FliL
VAVIAGLVLMPVLISASVAWLDYRDTTLRNGRPLPHWVTPGEVRASTRDGTLVKLRVALDTADSSNKSAVESHLREINLLLEVSIGSHERNDLLEASGIVRLAEDMQQRVNAYLETENVPPLRSVVIQDLWYAQP